MNLEILSNTVIEGRDNERNNFEMKLLHPIDTLNKPVFLEVLEVSYPATTKNIGKTECWFILQIFYENLKKNEFDVFQQNKLYFSSNEIIVPEGIYNLEKLIIFLYNMLEEYDIFVSKDNNGKIKISTNLYIEYWLNERSSGAGKQHDGEELNKFHLSSKSCENLQKKF